MEEIANGCQKHPPNFCSNEESRKTILFLKSSTSTRLTECSNGCSKECSKDCSNGLGVFNISGRQLPVGIIFGPYVGKILTPGNIKEFH